jgi:hypothetical protein
MDETEAFVEFQSHNGAIAASGIDNHLRQNLGFNPTMVRLLPRVLPSRPLQPRVFQSHNGAIAALSKRSPYLVRRLFQSHNGAIAAIIRFEYNSSFDNVSIPQWCDCCSCDRYDPQKRPVLFQSHNGAIAAGSFTSRHQCASVVSIPQWCDCC